MKHVIKLYEKKIEEGSVTITEMKEVLSYLRHERLIHLLVTIATGLIWIFMIDLMLKIPFLITGIVFLIITVLFVLYIHYYCYLENHVQRLSDETLKLFEKQNKE